ncbi:transglycosylase domain-containing protein [Alkalibacillus salilacus]|uniref:Penicillin-binding protein n=1 Tax=Alkalibacillus salilacus TaxID=284582 RepID=A0ABT9VGS6_9BACI|nr:transglycosylase domain-containing protein [Alkalibacillus salilacus]MDQ0160156.1 penicillin-binding protein [Alkalibacillus salilacus]
MSNQKSDNKFLAFFQKGKFPKYTRVSLDIAWNVLLFFIIIGVTVAFFIGGLGFGYLASLVEDVEVSEASEMTEMVHNYEETSEVYFADEKYLGEIRGDIHREEISSDQVSQTFIDAVIATEDENFYEHEGIVPKAIMRALYQQFAGTPSQTGGSTLTQQIVKNQILSNEVSFERKAEEIFISLRLEQFIDKENILEAYLNVVPFGRDSSGRNIAGIQAAAQGIFDVNAEELNIPQAAFIAGLPQNPYVYTPYANGGELKPEDQLQPGLNRMESVLERMHDAERISDQEYEEALNYDIISDFTQKTESIRDDYPFVADEVQRRARDVLAEQLAEDQGELEEYNNVDSTRQHYRDLAMNELRHSGLKVHTTIKKDIYDEWQKTKNEFDNYGRTVTTQVENPNTGEVTEQEIPVEAGAMMIENNSGAILSFVGGRDFDRRQVNNATYNTRPPGSTMKPLFGYAVGMELGIIQPGSPLLNVGFDYYPGDPWSPNNYISYDTGGFVSAREALRDSDNIPASRLMIDIIEKDGNPKRFLDKMGIDDGQNVPANVLGESPYMTVEENVSAYTTFANEGNYKNPYMVERIEDDEGNVIYEHESESEEVFSPQTAYLTIDMMRDVVNNGTAASLNYTLNNPGVDWAGKTGTSQDYKDAWFVGTNPNVTVGTWMGYYNHDQVVNTDHLRLNTEQYSRRNLQFWSQLVNSSAEMNSDLVTPSESFSSPGGIVSRSYCGLTGNAPSDMCAELGLVETDLFNTNYAPSSSDDDIFSTSDYVEIDGDRYPAVDATPSEFTEEGYTMENDFIDELGWGTTYSSGWSDPVDMDQVVESDDIPDLINIEDELDDEGTPSAPSNVSVSGGTLNWSEADGQVVGYRVYRAADEDSSFSEVGNTTSTEFSLPTSDSVYAVRAVSLYGHESDLSDSVIYGSLEEEEEESDSGENGDSEEANDSGENGDSEETNDSEESGDSEETNESEENGDSEETNGSEENGDSEETNESEENGDSEETNGSEENGDSEETNGSEENGDSEETNDSEENGDS